MPDSERYPPNPYLINNVKYFVVLLALKVLNADITSVEMRKTQFVEIVENPELKIRTIGVLFINYQTKLLKVTWILA